MHVLSSWGWSPFFQAFFQDFQVHPVLAARVISEYPDLWRVVSEAGEELLEISGKFRHQAMGREDFPAVGDWVVLDNSRTQRRIEAVLPRRSAFIRRSAGSRDQAQVVAANLDTVFLVMALNHDFNLRRLERYLAIAWESNAQPVVVLNKADLVSDPTAALSEIERIATGVPILVLSALERKGIEQLNPWLGSGKTVALLGSSGVGKSTLVNALLGVNKQLTSEISSFQDKGKHTTTRRDLLQLPGGALILDTPGMRELQIWEAGSGIEHSFEEIQELIQACRFRNCQHGQEKGCAVQEALASGVLDSGRWQNYRKLMREEAHQERKHSQIAQIEEKKRWKQIHKSFRQRNLERSRYSD